MERPRPRLRGVLTVLFFASLPLVVGLLLEFAAQAYDARRFPPPGRLLDVGGHRLHLHCMGSGYPTVVFEAGKGGYSIDWGLVQPEAAKFARVCSYDRAGHAWSDANPKPRTPQDVVAELRTLLQKAGEPGPYLLVGHSYGGVLTRLYAHNHRDEVAGMILVHSGAGPLGDDKAPDSAAADAPSSFKFPSTQELLRRFGLLRIWKWTRGDEALPGAFQRLPPPLRDARVAFTIHPRALHESWGEGVSLVPAHTPSPVTLADPGGSLGDKPLLVLYGDLRRRARMREGQLTPQQYTTLMRELHANQAGLAALSANSRLISIADCTHFVQLDRPDVVVDAIRKAVEFVRHKTPLPPAPPAEPEL